MRMRILISCFALLFAFNAHAANFVGNDADTSVSSTVTDSTTAVDLTVGGFGGYRRAVIPFLLPDLGVGSFTDATFSVYLNGVTASDFNFSMTMNGLTRIDTLPAVLQNDYNGPSTLLQSNFVDVNTPLGWQTTLPASSSTICGWLNTQYANGANAGKYVFIVLNANVAVGSPTYTFYSMSSPGTGVDPVGTYTFAAVPEPSIYGLIGAGALLGAAFMRRRKHNEQGAAPHSTRFSF